MSAATVAVLPTLAPGFAPVIGLVVAPAVPNLGAAAAIVLLAAASGALAVPGRSAGARHPTRARAVPTGGVAGAAAAGLVAAGWLIETAHLVLALTALAAAVAVTRQVIRSRHRVRADARAEQVLLAAEGMAADLDAGQPPLSALRRAAEQWSELAPAARAAEFDADVGAALRGLATRPGAARLVAVAAAWEVAHRSGASMASVLTGVAETLRAERRTARMVAAELASARATARMLAVLPGLVLVLGKGIGTDPLRFLLEQPIGQGCLVSGLSLSWLGLVWLDRIADTVADRR